MNQVFSEVKIVSMDEKASNRPNPNSDLCNIVLKLSNGTPYEWSEAFLVLWKQNMYMKKCKVDICGDSLTIYCMPDELKDIHIPELNRVISETNTIYSKHLERLNEERIVARGNAEKDKEIFKNLNTGFDL